MYNNNSNYKEIKDSELSDNFLEKDKIAENVKKLNKDVKNFYLFFILLSFLLKNLMKKKKGL